jgi:hypothetical protein
VGMEDDDVEQLKHLEAAELVTQIAQGDFGHIKIKDHYPNQKFKIKEYIVTSKSREGEFEVFKMAELKAYFFDKSATFIDLITSIGYEDYTVKFRIPKVPQNFTILGHPVRIELPPVTELSLYIFNKEQMEADWYQLLVYPLADTPDERKKIVEYYKLQRFPQGIISIDLLNELNAVYNDKKHLVFDITISRKYLLPIQTIQKVFRDDLIYKDIHLRMWINNEPFYIF